MGRIKTEVRTPIEITDGTIKTTTEGTAVSEPVQDRAVGLSQTAEREIFQGAGEHIRNSS